MQTPDVDFAYLNQFECRWRIGLDFSPLASSTGDLRTANTWFEQLKYVIRPPDVNKIYGCPPESFVYKHLRDGLAALVFRANDLDAISIEDAGGVRRLLVARVLVGSARILTAASAIALIRASFHKTILTPLPGQVRTGDDLSRIDSELVREVGESASRELAATCCALEGLQEVVAAALRYPRVPMSIVLSRAGIEESLTTSSLLPLLWGLQEIAAPLLSEFRDRPCWNISFSTFEGSGISDPAGVDVAFRPATYSDAASPESINVVRQPALRRRRTDIYDEAAGKLLSFYGSDRPTFIAGLREFSERHFGVDERLRVICSRSSELAMLSAGSEWTLRPSRISQANREPFLSWDKEFAILMPSEQVFMALCDIEKVMACIPDLITDIADDDLVAGQIRTRIGRADLAWSGIARLAGVDETALAVTFRLFGRNSDGLTAGQVVIRLTVSGDDRLSRVTLHATAYLADDPAHVNVDRAADFCAAILEQSVARLAWSLLEEPQLRPMQRWHCKLVVAGDGNVGKTSLVKALSGATYDAAEPTTHGMRVTKLLVPHPVEPQTAISLAAWDFGGQQVYEATHQFFLTDCCLVILVWSARSGWEQSRLRHWLDLVTARVPESQILLVATHGSERAPLWPPHKLLSNYPQIIGRFSVDSSTGEGIAGLRDAISAAAAVQPLIGAWWKGSWLRAVESCHELEQDYVSLPALHKLFTAAGVTELDEQKQLTMLMHELGDLLLTSQDQDKGDTVVVRPQWLNTKISAILDAKSVADRGGLLTSEDMARIWTDIERGVREQLLDLMDTFDVCYRVEDRGGRSGAIIVNRLPLDRPIAVDEQWTAALQPAGATTLRMRYVLAASLPPGIPSWFIAREQRFGTGLNWQSGTLLRHQTDKHLALVTSDDQAGTVDLEVRGVRPASFFWLLHDGLAMTFARYPSLTVTRLVLCPCEGTADPQCATAHNYDKLVARLSNGQRTIRCPESDRQVGIDAMLYGIPPGAEQVLDILEQDTSTGTDSQELAQRAFMKNWNLRCSLLQAQCPGVFTLTSAIGLAARLAKKDYALRLYCEEPGTWHPLPGQLACYTFTESDETLGLLTAHLSKVLAILKHSVPITDPVLRAPASSVNRQLQQDIAQMESHLQRTGTAYASRPSDADADAVIEGLFRLDPEKRWTGLTRISTPEGLSLYLCQDHLARYHAPADESLHRNAEQAEQSTETAGHVFISYVHEDSVRVDQLQAAIERAGIKVWRDTADLWPGEDWRAKIRYAITNDALVFLACFSSNTQNRKTSYQNEELALAIEQIRLRPQDRPWIVPVRFDECAIPAIDIGGSRTLASIQRADLFGNQSDQKSNRLIAAIQRILDQR